MWCRAYCTLMLKLVYEVCSSTKHTRSKPKALLWRLLTLFPWELSSAAIYRFFLQHSPMVMCNVSNVRVFFDARDCRVPNRAQQGYFLNDIYYQLGWSTQTSRHWLFPFSIHIPICLLPIHYGLELARESCLGQSSTNLFIAFVFLLVIFQKNSSGWKNWTSNLNTDNTSFRLVKLFLCWLFLLI